MRAVINLGLLLSPPLFFLRLFFFSLLLSFSLHSCGPAPPGIPPPSSQPPLAGALQCNFLIAVYQGGGMRRVSMPSDLAATSPLLLQLLIPQGFTLQSRSAQTQSQTQPPPNPPLAPPGPPARHRASPQGPGPLDQPGSHTLDPWLQELSYLPSLLPTSSTSSCVPHLSDYKQTERSRTVALLIRLCCHSVREASMLRRPFAYEALFFFFFLLPLKKPLDAKHRCVFYASLACRRPL